MEILKLRNITLYILQFYLFFGKMLVERKLYNPQKSSKCHILKIETFITCLLFLYVFWKIQFFCVLLYACFLVFSYALNFKKYFFKYLLSAFFMLFFYIYIFIYIYFMIMIILFGLYNWKVSTSNKVSNFLKM